MYDNDYERGIHVNRDIGNHIQFAHWIFLCIIRQTFVSHKEYMYIFDIGERVSLNQDVKGIQGENCMYMFFFFKYTATFFVILLSHYFLPFAHYSFLFALFFFNMYMVLL